MISEMRELYVVSLQRSLPTVYRDISCPDAHKDSLSQLPDGTSVAFDEEGAIRWAEYASGIKMAKIDESNMVLKSADGSFWFGKQSGLWQRLD